MAYPENTADSGDGGFYANEGTAAHTLASTCLINKDQAHKFVGTAIHAGKDLIEVTEEFADPVQTYVDDVLRRAIGGYLKVERRVTLDGVEGFDKSNYGTSDVIIAIDARRDEAGSMPAYGVVEDLKFGQGERVYAWVRAQPGDPFTMTMYPVDGDAFEVVPNYQLMMYALACLRDIELLVGPVSFIRIVINQPRLGMVSELDVPRAVLERFALFAADAKHRAELALGLGVATIEKETLAWLNPGEKQCRWCRAQARCPALTKFVQESVGADFDVIETKGVTVATSTEGLSKAARAVPLVAEWCKAVMAELHKQVEAGIEVKGSDGKPYKFVEGDLGDRKWADEKVAEAALLGILPPEKAYQPQKILTAAGAAKVLDKKATKQTWADVFVPLIKRPPGKPKLVLGSDPRPPYTPSSGADEFDDVEVQ